MIGIHSKGNPCFGVKKPIISVDINRHLPCLHAVGFVINPTVLHIGINRPLTTNCMGEFCKYIGVRFLSFVFVKPMVWQCPTSVLRPNQSAKVIAIIITV